MLKEAEITDQFLANILAIGESGKMAAGIFSFKRTCSFSEKVLFVKPICLNKDLRVAK